MKKLSDTWRLTLSYLAIIMTLSIFFSTVVFMIISMQLNQPIPRDTRPGVSDTSRQLNDGWSSWQQARLIERNDETRGAVLLSLVLLNTGLLVSGTAFSYFLARRTLEPIEASMKAQAQFVSDASHELRTPLTALLTSNEVALRKKVLTSKKAREVLSQNVAEISKLQELTNSLLGLARDDQELEKAKKTKILQLADEVINQLKPAAASKKITIKNQVPKTLSANLPPVAVSQILTILVDNAIKYSPEKSSVEITAKRSGKSLKLSVCDQGPGIALKDQARIFERFYRTDSARTRGENSGYGLGLAIAKKLADKHNWRLAVKSQPGSGAEFTLTVNNC